MNTNDMKAKISTLWIVVMLNMLSADIIGFMNPGDLVNGECVNHKKAPIKVAEENYFFRLSKYNDASQEI